MKEENDLSQRRAPIDMTPEQFRTLGHSLIDRVADLLGSMRVRPVTPDAIPNQIREALGAESPLPDHGADPQVILDRAASLLIDNSLYNGHPRFWGYITSSPAPIGMLGDLLAAAVNPNVGGWKLSPMASEVEAQTIRWIAELIGYPPECGGVLTSGGNVANFAGVLAARAAKARWDVRARGLHFDGAGNMTLYASTETHTWLQKAADLFGFGTDAIGWVPADGSRRMGLDHLRRKIERDVDDRRLPFLVIASAGTVSTGAVDPIRALAEICREHDMWLHIDGAYGGFAAALPEAPEDLHCLELADSVAVDPHKWLYAPLEAGCVLVRDPDALHNAFSYHPPYYHFEQEAINYFDHGLQNSRGFRALKVWLALQQVGREGYVRMIRDDIGLAEALYRRVSQTPELQAFTQALSITTFRYLPPDYQGHEESPAASEYLNQLNEEILVRLERGGEVFLSNAMIGEIYALRACVVNFRTTLQDIEALPEIVVRVGQEADRALRSQARIL